MEVEYELSQQLQGHEGPVRCCTVLADGGIVTAGGKGDNQVIVWRLVDGKFAAHKRLSLHQEYVYALAPSHSQPGGFYSGGMDTTAMRWDADANPVAQYTGHEKTVGSIVERGGEVITGSWDGTIKIWDAATGALRHTLEAGVHSVTVAVLPTGDLVCGSQDRTLRVFHGTECLKKIDEAHGDIIKAISVSSSNVVTASNDNSLKVWSLDGCKMADLTGHSSFVFGVVHSQDNKSLISSSDDCTIRVWSAETNSCSQSIVHGATVWQAACLPNGDIVSACADTVVRIWTNDPARMTTEDERKAQKEIAEAGVLAAASKGSSSVPMEGTADISEMPSTIGKKNGEIKCFKDGATIWAFSWNAGARQWDKIGEVVGSEDQKKKYEGDPVFPAGDYDYIFDVDMGPAHGMRRLPYNRGQNPMEIAEGFCSREQINKENTEQIRQFIIQNAGQGVDTGSSGGGYPSGSSPSAAPEEAEMTSDLLPVMQVATFKDWNSDGLQGKILEFNEQVDEAVKLPALDIQFLKDSIGKLKLGVSTQFRASEKEIIFIKLKEWPKEKIFPVIDLWRIFLTHPASSDYFKGSDRGTPLITHVLKLFATDHAGPLGTCCARWLANLFLYQSNKYSAFDKRDLILKAIEPALTNGSKAVKVACASVLLNIAIVLHESSMPPKQWDAACAKTVASMALATIDKAAPAEADAVKRSALAIGSLLPRDRKNETPVAKLCTSAGFQSKLAAIRETVGASFADEILKFMA